MKKYRFGILCNGVVIQSGNVSGNSSQDAYWRFIKAVHNKENPKPKKDIIHRSQGGSDEASNLVALCRECHDKIHRVMS